MNTILTEKDIFSLTRLLAFASFTLFTVVSLYLMYNNISWSGYDTFSNVTGIGGLATQLVNKFINSKYNTPSGEAGKPVGGE